MSEAADPATLIAQGQLAEAETASERRLESHPDDPAALKIAALGALRRAQFQRARELLERAAQISPHDSTVLYHLARAREASGDREAALAADAAAVRAEPAHALARLHLALGLEHKGEQLRALAHFIQALKDAQASGHWLNADSTPAALRPLVEHAVGVVRHGQRAWLEQMLHPLAQKHGRAGLERVYAATRIYVGEQQPVYPDPRQQPTFFYIPGLPTAAYFDRRLFGWLPAYEALYPQIRRELEPLLQTSTTRERVFHTGELEAANLRGSEAAPSWDGYYFYRHGERREPNCAACPLTARALDALPLIRIREHGPEVLFSVFTAGTHLLPHRGVTNARAVSHLPLIIPADCALSVGGEVHAWREGRTLVFDDTYEHEAWNRSSHVRVVLIADVWNPHLSEVERAAISDVIAAIGDLRAAREAD
jgi:tetratricopeptide (TPR) repeat protein